MTSSATQHTLPKRFYETVTTSRSGLNYLLLLDGKAIKSRAGNNLQTPYAGLVKALVTEWSSQHDVIDMRTMPMTRYQMTLNDSDDELIRDWGDQILSYLKNDHMCYRADRPDGLVERQHRIWDPLLAQAEESFGFIFAKSVGIIPLAQPEETMKIARDKLAQFNVEVRLGVRRITELTSSAILGFLATRPETDVNDIIMAAQLDEIFQADQWGHDPEAVKRRALINTEITEAMRFITLTRS